MADVIIYNALAKEYAETGHLDTCFGLFDHMKAKGIVPSQVTFGICSTAASMTGSWTKQGGVLQHQGRRLRYQHKLCTKLFRGFACAEQVDKGHGYVRTDVQM